ncbi:MAG: non-heme iron oxygenase ferredoxin subunit [Nocardioidaceae bacterium]|nr:non-heme iron oxygenase ferredoxin subunit [Nocardioidaceae bacterium]
MAPFQPACSVDDVPPGGVTPVVLDGVEVAIVRVDDGVYAIRDECSHAAIALSEGEVDAAGCEIECWLHGSRFDLRTGKPTSLPAYEPVPIYPCKIEGDTIVVDLENPFNDSEN